MRLFVEINGARDSQMHQNLQKCQSEHFDEGMLPIINHRTFPLLLGSYSHKNILQPTLSKIQSRPDLLDICKVQLKEGTKYTPDVEDIKPAASPEINSPLNSTAAERRRAFGLHSPAGN